MWKTGPDHQTVIKVFERRRQYAAELGCYQRLQQHDVRKIGRFAVPRLVDSSEGLLVVEMTLVTPPYVIDFGKSYLDFAPEHSPETWADHEASQRELWGEHYAEVQAVLWELQRIGIHYRDASPRNIAFPSGETDGDV